MAISTLTVTSAQLAEFDAAWVHVTEWADEAWRCSTSAPLLPDRLWVRSLVEDPTNGVIVARERQQGHGVAVYRREDGRILWLLCNPARFVDAASKLISAVTAAAGVKAWGVMSQPGPRQALLDAGVIVVRPVDGRVDIVEGV